MYVENLGNIFNRDKINYTLNHFREDIGDEALYKIHRIIKITACNKFKDFDTDVLCALELSLMVRFCKDFGQYIDFFGKNASFLNVKAILLKKNKIVNFSLNEIERTYLKFFSVMYDEFDKILEKDSVLFKNIATENIRIPKIDYEKFPYKKKEI